MTSQEIFNDVANRKMIHFSPEEFNKTHPTLKLVILDSMARYASQEIKSKEQEIERLKGQLEFDTDHIGRMHHRIESQQQEIERLKEGLEDMYECFSGGVPNSQYIKNKIESLITPK